MMPIFISDLITSVLRSAMRLASSCTVMLSGMITSRMTRLGSWCCLQRALFLLPRALDGGQRAHALAGVLVERLDDGHLAGAPARLVAARRQRLGRRPAGWDAWPCGASSSSSASAHGAARGAHHIGLDALDRGLAFGFGFSGSTVTSLARLRRPGRIDLAAGLGGLAARLFGGGLGRPLRPRGAARFLGLLDAAHFVVARGLLQRLQARGALARGQVGEMGRVLGAELGGGERQCPCPSATSVILPPAPGA